MGKQLSPACPECGDRYCKVIRPGADDQGHAIRERRCQNCGTKFPTVEVVVPGTTFGRLDVEWATYQKLWARKKRGYHGQRGRPKETEWITKISIRLSSRAIRTYYIEKNQRKNPPLRVG